MPGDLLRGDFWEPVDKIRPNRAIENFTQCKTDDNPFEL